MDHPIPTHESFTVADHPQPNQKPVGPSGEQEDCNLQELSNQSFQSIKPEVKDSNSPSDSQSFHSDSESQKKKIYIVKLVVVMSSAGQDISSIRLHTEKLDVNNFCLWRWGIINTLAYKNLDSYILAPHTPKMQDAAKYKLKQKQVTNFICMHLSCSNLDFFYRDIMAYNPKTLWDNIVSHFAAKTVENSANALDRLLLKL
jgi:hypothetical protein